MLVQPWQRSIVSLLEVLLQLTGIWENDNDVVQRMWVKVLKQKVSINEDDHGFEPIPLVAF